MVSTSQNSHTTRPPRCCSKFAFLTRTVDPTGAVTDFACNQAGDPTQVSQTIRAVAGQGAQTRVTTTIYDALGRVKTSDPPGNGIITYTYDKSGRLLTVDQPVLNPPSIHT